jgi:hypothetical protein
MIPTIIYIISGIIKGKKDPGSKRNREKIGLPQKSNVFVGFFQKFRKTIYFLAIAFPIFWKSNFSSNFFLSQKFVKLYLQNVPSRLFTKSYNAIIIIENRIT